MENRNRYRNNWADFNNREQYGAERPFNVQNNFSQHNRGWDSDEGGSSDRFTSQPYRGQPYEPYGYDQHAGSGYNQYDTNYNYRNEEDQNYPAYGDVYRGNVQQREQETGRARGGRFLSSGNDDRYRDDYRNTQHNDRGWWDRTTDEVSSWFGGDSQQHRDDRPANSHRGKGPRGYSRSDERIQDDVCHRLYEDSYVDASDIEVKVEGANVILSGTASSREEKRRAEDLAERISGVRNVENRIRVNHDGQNRWQGRDGNDRHTTMRDYTGSTDNVGGIGNESGTTNEIIRNEGRRR